MVVCPRCKSEKFYMEQSATTWKKIEAITEDGIQAGELVETHYEYGELLFCHDCGLEMGQEEYLKAQEQEVAND